MNGFCLPFTIYSTSYPRSELFGYRKVTEMNSVVTTKRR